MALALSVVLMALVTLRLCGIGRYEDGLGLMRAPAGHICARLRFHLSCWWGAGAGFSFQDGSLSVPPFNGPMVKWYGR
ncbi:MAG: hypothetical protein R3D61_11425 [Defluviimonas denitrificans]